MQNIELRYRADGTVEITRYQLDPMDFIEVDGTRETVVLPSGADVDAVVAGWLGET